MDAGPRLAVVSRTVAADPHGRREATDCALGSRRCTDRQRQHRQAGRRRKQGARNDDDARADEGYLPKPAVGGLDDYHCFLLEPHLAQDAYVTSAVIKPQRSTIVHHVILFEASGAERSRCATTQRRLGRQRLDLLRRPGPVGDASDFRFGVERPAGRAALDQRLGPGPHRRTTRRPEPGCWYTPEPRS